MKNLLILIATILSLTSTAQTAKEIEMVNLVNQVRTNPKSFVPVVEAYITEVSTPWVIIINGVSHKGSRKIDPALVSELKQLIVFLNTVKPVSELKMSSVLYPITKQFVTYLDSTKQVGHVGPNGQSLLQRTKSTGLTCGENSTVGDDANHAMVLLLLDFKGKTKGHRDNIFRVAYTKISVANSGAYWVQDFAL